MYLCVYVSGILEHTLRKNENEIGRFSWHYERNFWFLKELYLWINPSSANFTKWSNTLKQFVDKLPTNCLSVFDDFVGLALKGLRCGNCLSRSNIHSTHFEIEIISNITAKMWNKIPNEIKEATSLTAFKSKIKK